MSDFQNSQEQAFRRLVREAIRKCPDFTKSERDVCLAMVNLWFHHKGGPKGYIHPGRALLAKRAKCTEKTVSRSLAKLRAIGAIIPLNEPNGGRIATRYQVSISDLLIFCGHEWVAEFMAGHRMQNVPVSGAKMSRFLRDKMSPCIRDVAQGVSRRGSSDV